MRLVAGLLLCVACSSSASHTTEIVQSAGAAGATGSDEALGRDCAMTTGLDNCEDLQAQIPNELLTAGGVGCYGFGHPEAPTETGTCTFRCSGVTGADGGTIDALAQQACSDMGGECVFPEGGPSANGVPYPVCL